jgi:UDP-2,4-diacetamido-2,4,6-trideoxy-beta-L-altropyranose hydrolase
MRCLALAQAWQDAGGQGHFALASQVPALEARLRDEGMSVHHLEPEVGNPLDAAATAELAHQLGAAWVVADGYHLDATYQQAIRAAELKLLFIDDYGHAGRYCADVVLNQNIYADESLYACREPHTHLLLGTRYALLRREFWPWRGWRREIPTVARKVLVTLGGSDPDNLTLTVLRALQRVDVDGLEVVVVVGGSNPHFQELEAASRHSLPGGAIRLVRNVTDMPELMAWADMAVSGGGSTCWELAFMGLPSLALILAENQRPVITGLDAAGAVINLGQPAALAPIEIARSLTELAATPGKRAAMTERGQALVDGDGARRVVQRMLSRALTLRPVQADDCRLIWEWANDPLTRAVSFSVEPIPWEKHMAWFTDRLSDPRCRFYIALDATAQPIGQIRYQIEGEEAVVSVSLALEQRGKGYGAQVIRLGSEIIFSSTTVRLIHAYVKPDNTGSACAFANAGFVNDGLMEIQGHSALHFVLRK